MAERISDGPVLALIDRWLRQDFVQELKRWTPTGGTPQGAVLSPLLANIYLHPLDQHMQARGYRMVRYADDFVVLCQSGHEAQQALAEIQGWMRDNELELNMDKTSVGDCRHKGQGFEFLGYRFEEGPRMVRKKSLKKLKDAIRERTGRTRGSAMREIVAELNAVLRGWYAYFRHACQNLCSDRRLRSQAPARDPAAARQASGARTMPRRPSPMAHVYFAHLGLFTMSTARQAASQSR